MNVMIRFLGERVLCESGRCGCNDNSNPMYIVHVSKKKNSYVRKMGICTKVGRPSLFFNDNLFRPENYHVDA